MLNLSIQSLSIIGLKHGFAGSKSFFSKKNSFRSIFIGNSFANFYYSSGFCGLTQFYRCNFKKFLGSPIYIDKLMFSNLLYNNNPLEVYLSFFVSKCNFTHNFSPFSGGSILSVGSGIIGTIIDSFFYNNTATNGGAIFFASPNGILNISGCEFKYNEAKNGGSLFLSVLESHINNSIIQFTTSQAHIIITESNLSVFRSCNFYKNNGFIDGDIDLNPNCLVFFSCCFTQNNVSPFSNRTFFTLDQCCINSKIYSLTSQNSLANGISSVDCLKCEVYLPTRIPSSTYNKEIEKAFTHWFTIGSVSITGVIFLGLLVSSCRWFKLQQDINGSTIIE